MLFEFAQVQIRGGCDALVSGDGPARPRLGSGVLSAARSEREWPSAARQVGSANASSACRRKLSRGTTQQTRSMIPVEINRAAAITGSSDLPPPGVTAARRSRASVCPHAMASITPAS